MARRKSIRRRHRPMALSVLAEGPQTNWLLPIAVGATAVATAVMFFLQKRKVTVANKEIDRLVAAGMGK